MSIVPCVQCGKRISSLASVCPHCGFQRGDASEEDMAVLRLRQARDRVYRLNMVSYVLITLMVAGFGWYWWGTQGFTQPSPAGPFLVMAASALGYVVVRGLLFQARRRLKEIRSGNRL